MEQKVVKLGLVGVNRGSFVVSEILNDKNLTLYAICDKNPERLAFAKKYYEDHGVKNLLAFEKLEDFLASDVEAVYIATDAKLHTNQVIQALEAGKHVISEIPSINSVDEAVRLKAAVKAHPNQKYMIGENACFWSHIKDWKTMREKGTLGEIVYAEGEYIHTQDFDQEEIIPLDFFGVPNYLNTGWRKYLNAITYLTHDLGPLLYIMNDRCVSVTCMEPTVRYDPEKVGSENGVALFRTEKGAVIKILVCFGAYAGGGHNFCIYGTKGSLENDRGNSSTGDLHIWGHLSSVPTSFDKKMEIPTAPMATGGHGGADAKMMRYFIKCIVDDVQPELDVDFAIDISIPGVIAHESALQGGKLMEIPVIN